MAIEMKVYQEITAYQAKVMMGMSWRQLACAAGALVFGGGGFALTYFFGLESISVATATLLAAPFGLVGWVRPSGLPFEEYAEFMIRHQWDKQLFVYGQQPVWRADRERSGYGRPFVESKKRDRIEERGN